MDLLSYFIMSNGSLQLLTLAEILDYLAASPALDVAEREQAKAHRRQIVEGVDYA